MSSRLERDRIEFINVLSTLPRSQFEALVDMINPPHGTLPPASAPQRERVIKLLEWLEGPDGSGTGVLWRSLHQILRPQTPRRGMSRLSLGRLGLALIIVGAIAYIAIEPVLRQDRIKNASAQIRQKGPELSEAVNYITDGCPVHRQLNEFNILQFLLKPVLGNCISLSEYDLSGSDLSQADLRATTLSAANLSAANLSRANFSNADLSQADLSHANLAKVHLSDAILSQTVFNHADLLQARLVEANLNQASLSQANLSQAYLNGANLSQANLSGANLSEAFLSTAVLNGADLSQANLKDSFLSGANFRKANLSQANLNAAVLSNVNFREANLAAADLRHVLGLTARQLTGEQPPYLCNTALPATINSIDANRDCSQLPQVLVEDYAIGQADAQALVNRWRQLTWD